MGLKYPIHVIGLGLEPAGISLQAARRLYDADIIAGGARILERFNDHNVRKIVLSPPFEEAFRAVLSAAGAGKRVIVLLEGDPLFFNIGKALMDMAGPEMLRFHPGVTALQVAASRIKIPWENMAMISLSEQKNFLPLWRALTKHAHVAIYTDSINSPALIAAKIMEKGGGDFEAWIFENLGTDEEHMAKYPLERIAKMEFSPFTLLLIESFPPPKKICLDLPDSYFEKYNYPFIEALPRSMAFSLLGIEPECTVWDIGSGLGSIAIGASYLAHNGHVLAVEPETEQLRIIKESRNLFGAFIVDIIGGELPVCLENLPNPNRIFLRATTHYPNSQDILPYLFNRLLPSGRIVLITDSLSSLNMANTYLEQSNWLFKIVQSDLKYHNSSIEDSSFFFDKKLFYLAAEKPENWV